MRRDIRNRVRIESGPRPVSGLAPMQLPRGLWLLLYDQDAPRPFRAPPCGPGLLVGWTHRNTALRPGHTVATTTLWVTASVQGPKLALDLTRFGRGF